MRPLAFVLLILTVPSPNSSVTKSDKSSIVCREVLFEQIRARRSSLLCLTSFAVVPAGLNTLFKGFWMALFFSSFLCLSVFAWMRSLAKFGWISLWHHLQNAFSSEDLFDLHNHPLNSWKVSYSFLKTLLASYLWWSILAPDDLCLLGLPDIFINLKSKGEKCVNFKIWHHIMTIIELFIT